MAMRWSMWVAILPPPGMPPEPKPSTASQSLPSSILMPQAIKPSATAARRSLSLTRNSPNPVILVRPSAKAAAMARTGYSSIIDGAISGSTSTPFNGPALITRSPTLSPLSLRSFSIVMSAPMRLSTVMRPVRVGFSITASMRISDPGTMRAATMGKAADEGSAGTCTWLARSSGWPVKVMAVKPPSIFWRRTTAPKWVSMRSVWSRVGSASITVVSPGALRPASRTADFTWAEGTGSR